MNFVSKIAKPILDDLTNNVLKNQKIQFRKCIRQPPSILHLIESKKHIFKVTKCERPRCKTCNIIIECKEKIRIARKDIYFNANMNCTSKNVVYALFCQTCNKFYIGKTNQPLCNRITLHRQHMNDNKYTVQPVSHHLRQCGSNILALPIYQSSNDSSYLLLKLEKYFCTLLAPELNAF
jgi:hypothetical protein